jgi:hypothetical protein
MTPMQAALKGDLQAFFKLGGVRAVEREAVREALQNVRAEWLRYLEAWHAAYDAKDWDTAPQRLRLETAIATLRRQLGIRQSAAERRAKTAERVRQHRLRRAALT